ncbi:ARM repeat-containing protein [Venustampulla echinocandica]|uniref:ARM repeat-containing protein n=1 Tax=Venustampulla echinocandica TaxID=2656787 RepID=A0A370TA48_9HELO|nr:ARM repeat-containing protein [Venustampulla echinocandica]RDL30674.1 ARM repeat-containing protein [Venustampulla echinocandica]
MGKSKPRDRRRNRPDPTARPVKPPADPELAAIREQRILPVLKDLTSADLKTRSAAATAISNIIEDTKCRKLLLREQIVQILLEQTLTDSSFETRTAGWGILRNLALEEEADFCIHLYRQDVLTAIDGSVKTIIQTIESQETPFAQLPKPQQSLVWSLTSSLISLLASLAEAQDQILETISKIPTIPNFLFGLLSFGLTPSEVQNEVLSCLMALTEDNKSLVQQIVDNGDRLKGLMQIKDSGSVLAIAACGVLHNIFSEMQWSDHKAPKEGASDAVLIPSLMQFMDIQSFESNGAGPDQVLQLALEITASIATSLQEALEQGHEKEFEGFGDDTVDIDDIDDMDADEGNDNEEEGEANHEMDEDEIDADMDLVTGDDPEDDDASSDEPTLDLLVRNAAPKILLVARPSDNGASEAVRDSALSALNNIAWTVSSIDFATGHLDSLRKFWSTLAQRIWDEIISPVLGSNTADIELASSITSLAWAVSRSVQGSIRLNPEEARKFMALYQASKDLDNAESQANDSKKPSGGEADDFQSLGVKCIGVLGSLALNPAPVELNREVGVFLLTVLSGLPNTPAADTVEALNQIFDIYADKSFAFDEPVFWGDGFYKHLEEILPKARKLAKTVDKRRFEELRARIDEAVINLDRFLRYKKAEKEKSADA